MKPLNGCVPKEIHIITNGRKINILVDTVVVLKQYDPTRKINFPIKLTLTDDQI